MIKQDEKYEDDKMARLEKCQIAIITFLYRIMLSLPFFMQDNIIILKSYFRSNWENKNSVFLSRK